MIGPLPHIYSYFIGQSIVMQNFHRWSITILFSCERLIIEVVVKEYMKHEYL